MISVIAHRKIWYTLSSILFAGSVAVIVLFGLPLGIDFTGGTLIELQFTETLPSAAEVTGALEGLDVGVVTVQSAEDQSLIIRLKNLDEPTHQAVLRALDERLNVDFQELRFDSIGPSIGDELKRKTVWAIIFSILGIIGYIAWAFRKVSGEVSSWKYGVIAVLAVAHDAIVTTGVFVLLGKFLGLEMNATFIAAILTVSGYSVNDTIVVFDRTRENLIKRTDDEFEKVVDRSVNQTFTRSINTSLTTLIVLLGILLFGGNSVRDFVSALIVGIAIGAYSSIFVASPLLVTLEKWKRR